LFSQQYLLVFKIILNEVYSKVADLMLQLKRIVSEIFRKTRVADMSFSWHGFYCAGSATVFFLQRSFFPAASNPARHYKYRCEGKPKGRDQRTMIDHVSECRSTESAT
jgi:hypothetical protein